MGNCYIFWGGIIKTTAGTWKSKLPIFVAVIDIVAISISMIITQLTRFGPTKDVYLKGVPQANYWLLSIALAFVWWLLLELWGSRDIRFLGTGTEEFSRAAHASLALFGGVAIVSYALRVETARGYVALALPVGLVLICLSRLIIRRFINLRRQQGRFNWRLLILGAPAAVEHLYSSLSMTPHAGYVPVCAILPGYRETAPNGQELPIPVVSVSSEIQPILDAISTNCIDVLAISSGANLKPRTIRKLGWALHERGVSMIMVPALTDVAGPRMHTQPLAGLPLVHVSTPRMEGGQALLKRVFDIFGAGLILVLLSPLFLAIALLIKASSSGPVFYSQNRIGQGGRPFRMYKFRSMIVDADDQLENLLMAQGTSETPLFKVENDPRITPIGRILRQYSVDELPQLLNVLLGNMSLVGPRPQREAEVALYDGDAHRRLMVRPGMSGLWQVNGRSNLTWDESIRWDLYYVENWSLLTDIVILLKTFKAVIQKDGAV